MEYDRNRYQQLFVTQNEHNFEQTSTFLGCATESLRTILAKWVLLNESNPFPERISNLRETSFSTPISDDLQGCLYNLSSEKCLNSILFKMRVLWELQTYFRKELIASQLGPLSIHALALCLLSFPAVSMKENYSTDPADSVLINLDNREDVNYDFSPEDFVISVVSVGLQKV